MSDLLDIFGVDIKAERTGTWVNFAPDVDFLIARRQNPNHRAVMDQLSRDYVNEIAAGTIDRDVMRSITDRAIARAVWLGWRTQADGKDGTPAFVKHITIGDKKITYSEDAAFEILQDERLHDMREAILRIADSQETFRIKAIKEAEKN